MPSLRRAALLAALLGAILLLRSALSPSHPPLLSSLLFTPPLISSPNSAASFNDPHMSHQTSGKKSGQSKYKIISSSEIQSKFELMNIDNCSNTSLAATRQLHIINEHWQKVSSLPIYLYSAFYDVRYRYEGRLYNFIRIIMASEGKIMQDQSLFCQLWLNGKSSPLSVEGYFEEVWVSAFDPKPSPGMHHTYLLSCPLPKHVRTAPRHVSVSDRHCDAEHTKLPVQKAGLEDLRRGKEKDTFALCVKGLNFQEDLSDRIIEWVEMNRIQGAKHITFYVYSIHPNVWKVLRHYEKIKFATVVNITLPGNLPNDEQNRTTFLKQHVWQKRRSELVSYNDCLYRNIYKYNFVIPIDIDEILMPVKEKTWQKALKNVFRKNPSLLTKYSSLSVPHVYFFEKWNTSIPNGKDKTSKVKPLVPYYTNLNNIHAKNKLVEAARQRRNKSKYHMLYHTRRSANFSAAGYSVKSFVHTKFSLLTFNHYTLTPLLPSVQANFLLSQQDMQLNHYQSHCSRYILSKCIANFDKYSVQDDIMLSYSKELIDKVDLAHSKIFRM